MDIRYYIKNIFWGLIITGIVYYTWDKNPESERLTITLTLSIISCILYPYSKKIIEKIALRYSTKK
jgi:hypothetical protein